MAYVIAEPCIGNKDASCTEVCPVECIHPLPGEPGYDEAAQLFVDPEECIDCNACADECPVNAIFPAERLPDRWLAFAALNAGHYGDRARERSS